MISTRRYSVSWEVFLPFRTKQTKSFRSCFVFNPFKQASRIVNKTIDADNVIYNYEWFKRQWRDVQAVDKKIAEQEAALNQYAQELGPRKDWGRIDKEEYARLNSVCIGLKQQQADMKAEYNAKANMANREIFMGSDCPERIE